MKETLISGIFMGILSSCHGLFAGEKVFNYTYSTDLVARPYPTELLLKVINAKPIKTIKPLIDSPSIITYDYSQQLSFKNLKDNSEVSIKFTAEQLSQLGGLEPGMAVAAFGPEEKKYKIFQVTKLHKSTPSEWEEEFKNLK